MRGYLLFLVGQLRQLKDKGNNFADLSQLQKQDVLTSIQHGQTWNDFNNGREGDDNSAVKVEGQYFGLANCKNESLSIYC